MCVCVCVGLVLLTEFSFWTSIYRLLHCHILIALLPVMQHAAGCLLSVYDLCHLCISAAVACGSDIISLGFFAFIFFHSLIIHVDRWGPDKTLTFATIVCEWDSALLIFLVKFLTNELAGVFSVFCLKNSVQDGVSTFLL